MATESTPPSRSGFNPTAAVLAWLWPGLGHISLGWGRRGRLIMFGILFLFVGGLLVGGLDCVDRRNDPLWYLAQVLNGPIALATDFVNQTFIQTVPSEFGPGTSARARYLEGDPELLRSLQRIGLGHVNEMGTLFVALAGLMNLVVVLDALSLDPAPGRERRGGSGGS